MEFSTQGERLKKIREMLKMKQRELQDKNITRGFISMIESGRSTMSKETASAIAEKFNKRAKEIGINLNIDGEYLLMTPAEEAEYYCIQKLKEINNEDDLSKINELLEIAEKYGRKRVNALIDIKIGDIMYNANKYIDAILNYNKALELLMMYGFKEQIPYVYNMLGVCKMNITDYAESIFYFDKAINFADEINDKSIRNKAIYNTSLCYKHIGKYDVAIEYVEKFLKDCNKSDELINYIYASSIKANCFRVMGLLEKSLDVYKNLLNDVNDEDSIAGFIYSNIGEIYADLNDYEKSLEYFDKAEKVRRSKDKKSLSHTLIEKANVLFKMGYTKESISLMEESISIANKNNDIEYIIMGNYRLADIYKQLNDREKAINTYNKILEVAKNVGSIKELLKVHIKLSKLYLEDDNVDKCRNHLSEADKIAGSMRLYSNIFIKR
ncbi:helix-turn-helix transcriptional regulator [Thermoanaerobacterium thermosaccharolyticum]|uniref:helix-turn-helix domain-containing protein n=1 Tax=Thermoanaerobacterium thermosaccharolyticum TaxID=1517 RepID=UPI003DAA3D04